MTNQLTCFIAANRGSEKSQLRRHLENRSVTCLSLDWMSVSSTTDMSTGPSVSVQSLIQRSDFVAGILPPDPSPNLAFELGLAQGLGKPLLLFANDPSSVPFDLAFINFLPVSLLASSNWGDYVDTFLRTVHPSKTSFRKTTIRMAAGEPRRWREIRVHYDDLLRNRRSSLGVDLESLVERAFKQGGFSLSKSPSPDFGADFALTTPNLAAAFSLPILVEVKNNTRSSLTQDAINRLSMLIQNGRGGAGLIVTTQPDKATAYLKGVQPIVVVPFLELFEWLRRGTFEQEFLDIVDAFWTREH